MKYHEPVMLKETVEFMQPEEGKSFVDCTLGDGGHSLELLKKGSRVLGIDVYEAAIHRAEERFAAELVTQNFVGKIGNFKNLEKIVNESGFNKVNGILLDLGYSSYELEDAGIGLSFQSDGPLDMRLDKNLSVTAADLVNSLPETQLAQIIGAYGGERMAKSFTAAIVKARGVKRFQTTKDLSDLLAGVAPSNYENGRINPATRTFQALRIAVNDELENLSNALPQAARLLQPGGRILVITFHSLEDKIVKDFAKSAQPSLRAVTKKPIVPSEQEVRQNSRSRSAKLRVYERI